MPHFPLICTLPKKRAFHKTCTALLTSSLEVMPKVEIDKYTLVSSAFNSFRDFKGAELSSFYASQQEGL